MAIKTIEIICIPCFKCKRAQEEIFVSIKNLENKYKINIPFEFKHTTHLKDISKYSLNPSQIPAILINGNPEFCGSFKRDAILSRLDSIHRMG